MEASVYLRTTAQNREASKWRLTKSGSDELDFLNSKGRGER